MYKCKENSTIYFTVSAVLSAWELAGFGKKPSNFEDFHERINLSYMPNSVSTCKQHVASEESWQYLLKPFWDMVGVMGEQATQMSTYGKHKYEQNQCP